MLFFKALESHQLFEFTLVRSHSERDRSRVNNTIIVIFTEHVLDTKCYVCVCVLSCCSRVRLCDPVDCSPPGSSVHEILQAKNTGVGLLCPPPGELPKRYNKCLRCLISLNQLKQPMRKVLDNF